MWNKRNDESSPVRPQGEPMRGTPAPVAPQSSAPAMDGPTRTTVASAQPPAVIGGSMTIVGDIRAQQELVVDGEVDGLLESQSLLTIGPTGRVKGNIKAREVAIFGSVQGNVEVTTKIAIREQGSLIGDIRGAGIRIDDGAYFKGSVDIIRPETKTAKLAP
ncbi:MAG: polymer-forming cytoskeletal protein [Candidatus Solibacter sp.]